MSTLLQDLQTVLRPIASGGAFYQVNDSQPARFPYIVYARVISTANVNLQEASDLQNTRIQVDVYSRSLLEAQALADAVDAAMQTGPWQSAVPLSSQDFYDFEVRVFRIARDFSIWATN